MREAITRGDLGPNERLVEAELSETFGISRAAVRVALLRLEHDGLVERTPRRGARVRAFSDSEAVEILEMRAAIEGLAARYAACHVTRAEAAELRGILKTHRQLVRDQHLLAASDANAELHSKVLEISRHPTAQRLVRNLRSQTVRFQFRTILVPGRAEKSVAEHAAIVKAIVASEPERAEEAMRRHLLNVAGALGESSVGAAAGAGGA
jgi:DNA-binding GntR family transcriptional regulator